MSGYVDHGWRHAPKAAGGTDPVPTEAADLPWCRWRLLEEKVIDSAFFEDDAAYEVTNNYPEVFQVNEVGARRTLPLLDGMYSMNYRIFWNEPAPLHGVTIVGIESWEDYAITPGPVNTSLMSESGPAGSYTTRIATNLSTGIYPTVRFFASPYEAEAYVGTFFEIVRLGPATGDKLAGGADD